MNSLVDIVYSVVMHRGWPPPSTETFPGASDMFPLFYLQHEGVMKREKGRKEVGTPALKINAKKYSSTTVKNKINKYDAFTPTNY